MRVLRLAPTLVLLAACNSRFPVPGGNEQRDLALQPLDGEILYDGLLTLPDGPGSDALPAACAQETFPLKIHSDSRKNFVLGLPDTAVVRQVGFGARNLKESAAAVNLGEVAALAATREPQTFTNAPDEEMHQLIQRFDAALGVAKLGSLAVRTSGVLGTSLEGFADVKEAILIFSSDQARESGLLRNVLLASILEQPLGGLSNLPGPVAPPSGSLLIKLTLVSRKDQLAVVAAVADRLRYDNPTGGTFAPTDDMGNGTSIARAGTRNQFFCDRGKIKGNARADIIWVVDESGSMNDNRQDIVNNANVFFAKALAAGLDFRMGITGVKQPGSGAVMGKFCSKDTYDRNDDGGDDRFLLPSEKALFSGCVKNPPYFESGSEYGLTNAYHAVLTHLPRTRNSPRHIRPDAKLALIIVTDEAPQELKPGGHFLGQGGFLGYEDYRNYNCSLTQDKEQGLEKTLQPLVELLSGKTDPGGAAMVHLIAGTCRNQCTADMAHGYKELATLHGGQFGDVCQKDLGPTLQVMINSIAAAASPRLLAHVPISSTLVVEAQGLRLNRSRNRGFIYDPPSNRLTFNGIRMRPGHTVVASYRRFLPN